MAEPRRTKHVAADVDRDVHQPRFFAAIAPKSGHGPIGLEIGFLHGVFGQRRIVQLDIADAEQVGLLLPDQSGKALFRAFIRGNLHRRFTSLHLIDETAGRFVRFFEKKEAIYFHHAPIISCAQ